MFDAPELYRLKKIIWKMGYGNERVKTEYTI